MSQNPLNAKALKAAIAAADAASPTGNIYDNGIEAAIRAYIASQEAAAPSEEPVAWCQPMDCGKHRPRKFIVVYEDADVGMAVFDNEAEAREHWEKAYTHWNCYLFGALPRVASPAVAPAKEMGENWTAADWNDGKVAVAPVAVSVKGLIERLRNPFTYENGEIDDDLAIADMEAAAAILSSIIPATKGGEDPFEICAKVAEGHADLVEEMRGVYPGDPQGALGRDANKMRKLAKAIRALRPAALSAQDTDGVAK